MQHEDALRILNAMADSTRLRILRELMDHESYVEELAERLGIAASTTSAHLRKLEQAGLVAKERQQYYHVYHARRSSLDRYLWELVVEESVAQATPQKEVDPHRLRVLKSFTRDGRIERLPVQLKKRRIILEELATAFEFGRSYTEAEVNELILRLHDDFCTVRRELVTGGVLARDNGVYWLRQPLEHKSMMNTLPSTEDKRAQRKDSRRELVREYMDNPPPAGVFRITNKASGKVWLGIGSNLPGQMEMQMALLERGEHREHSLQADFDRLGAGVFCIDVLDTLKPEERAARSLRKELRELQALWVEKLQAWGERGYHKKPQKKG